jgi:hypothetical protein
LFDENTDPFVLTAALRGDPTLRVFHVGRGETPPLGTPDEEILKYCERDWLLLVTWDRSTIPSKFATHLDRGGHLPGVFLLRRGFAVADLVESLLLIDAAYREDDWKDLVTYVPL